MSKATMFVKEANGGMQIQQIEQLLTKLVGVERVLMDTEDGELKVEFDDRKVSKEEIISTLEQNNFNV